MGQAKRKSDSVKPLVGIIMGSQSDLEWMKDAAEILEQFGIGHEVTVVSAHRTPRRMFDYAEKAQERGLKVIIAGAGGAAHLPGMVASITTLPVIGVPIKSRNSLDGWDSLLSIVQMPSGIPVATVAVNASANAGILAAQIIALSDQAIAGKISQHKTTLRIKVEQSVETISRKGYKSVLKKS